MMQEKKVAEQKILDLIKSTKKVSASKLSKLSGYKDEEIRLIVNSLRSKSVPVIADNKGYYISFNPSDIKKQIKSYECRINAMVIAKNGLEKLLERIDREQQ